MGTAAAAKITMMATVMTASIIENPRWARLWVLVCPCLVRVFSWTTVTTKPLLIVGAGSRKCLPVFMKRNVRCCEEKKTAVSSQAELHFVTDSQS
jgi:hypothetical protein